MKTFSCLLLLLILFSGCNPRAYDIDACVTFEPPEAYIQSLPSSFEPLTPAELETDWGRELHIANQFGPDLDLYRAITGYKRALILIPKSQEERKNQIEYHILYSYFLAGKYQEVVDHFEKSQLAQVPQDFPAYRDMLVIIYFSYDKTGHPYRRDAILRFIHEYDQQLAEDLEMSLHISNGDLCAVMNQEHRFAQGYQDHFCHYQQNRLSVRKAQIFNAILPGAGYLYTGQRRTAITAFLLNAAFITATYELFHNGYPAAGVIVGSLEFGWYFGGINGAGLSAKYYNDQAYNCYAKEAMLDQRLFPILMLQRAF